MASANAGAVRATAKNSSRRKSAGTPFVDLLVFVAFVLFLVFLIGKIIDSNDKITEQQAMLNRLNEQYAEVQQTHDELERLLGNSEDNDFMLEAAISRGYSYPRERRFFPKSNLE